MEFLSTFTEMASTYFTAVVRWVFVVLALFILVRQIRSLLQMRNPSEIWAYLGCPDDTSVPLTHWENLIGRGRGCDIILNLSSVSRSHATLIRDSEGVWRYNDLNSKNGSRINGKPVKEPTVLKAGDVLNIGGSDFTLYPVSLQERMSNIEKRKRKTKSVSPWPSLAALTIFQILTIIQFRVALGEDFLIGIPFAFGFLCALMWFYVIFMRSFKRVGFETEIIAFFLSTLSLAVTTSAYPDSVLKQCACVAIGLALFFGLCWFLRDLNRAKKLTYILIALSVLLILINLIFGEVRNGNQNWVSIGGFSFQPSELVKVVFIYVGAATLDELQQRKNLTIFMLFSLFALGSLAIMGDFGTAMIFFVTFLVMSFLRSGDFTRIVLILGAAVVMGIMVLRFRPYIASRFDIWGHVWEDPTDAGYQQVQTMTSTASGGLPGLGAGEGNLSDVAASSTDLVFGLLSEEWGLIIAILATLCIITLGVFAVRSISAGRSTYYSIAACGATSMFVFQTILNVFGSLDLLPLTGVTFPFVSSGGTSMIASWGLLAFLKAADTRQNASFAIRLDKKGEFEEKELEGGTYKNPEEIIDDVPAAAAVGKSLSSRWSATMQRFGRSRQGGNSQPTAAEMQAYMEQRANAKGSSEVRDEQPQRSYVYKVIPDNADNRQSTTSSTSGADRQAYQEYLAQRADAKAQNPDNRAGRSDSARSSAPKRPKTPAVKRNFDDTTQTIKSYQSEPTEQPSRRLNRSNRSGRVSAPGQSRTPAPDTSARPSPAPQRRPSAQPKSPEQDSRYDRFRQSSPSQQPQQQQYQYQPQQRQQQPQQRQQQPQQRQQRPQQQQYQPQQHQYQPQQHQQRPQQRQQPQAPQRNIDPRNDQAYGTPPRSRQTTPEDTPVTLEDLFGGDDK